MLHGSQDRAFLLLLYDDDAEVFTGWNVLVECVINYSCLALVIYELETDCPNQSPPLGDSAFIL